MLAYRNSGQMDKARREKQELDKLQRPPEGEFTDFLKKLGEKPREAVKSVAVASGVLLFRRRYASRLPRHRQRGRPHAILSATAATRPNSTSSKPPAAASPSSTTTTTACPTSSSFPATAAATACTTTTATAISRTSRQRSVSTSSGWGQGVCAGDYDNDGYTDCSSLTGARTASIATCGGKRFEDVTAKAHLTQDRTRYNTGCAFLDYDRDGRLDLFVANYLKFDFATTPKPGANPYCFYRDMPVNCGPRGLPFDTNMLYHNKGDGTFEDVSGRSGIAEVTGHYALGVLTGDFNDDGLPDIYVACDQTPSLLYHQPGRRNVRGRGRAARRGVRRERPSAVRHGRGRGRL